MKSLLCMALLLWLPYSATAEPIQFDANESAPYWFSDGATITGMGVKLIDAIAHEADINTSIRIQPLPRLIENDHNNDLGNPLFYMEQQDFAAIIPFAIYYVAIFYYRPHFDEPVRINALNGLKGYKVGALKGTVMNQMLLKRNGIELEESYSRESLFKKLQHERIDFGSSGNRVHEVELAACLPAYFTMVSVSQPVIFIEAPSLITEG